jgi:hypothetical protein
VTRRHVPESVDPTAAKQIDIPGAVWAVLALSGLTFALIEGPSRGWGSPAIVSCLIVGLLAGAGFVRTERHSKNPMLPPGLFSARQFAATNVVTFVMYAALGGVLFLLPVALQQVAHYSPIEAGLSLLPVTGLMLLLSARSGRLASRIGPRLQMTLGPLVAGCGLFLLTRVATDSFYPTGVLPGVLVLGIGLVITVAPLTATAMSSAPGEHAGIASAVNNDVARAGGLVAVAVLPVVSSLTGSAYLHAATFAHGFRTAGLICAAMCGIGGLIAAVSISNDAFARPRRHELTDRVQCTLATPALTAPVQAAESGPPR